MKEQMKQKKKMKRKERKSRQITNKKIMKRGE